MKKHVRILSALMVVLLSLSIFSIGASAARAPIRYGDVFDDNPDDPFTDSKINIMDATYVQRAVAFLYSIEETRVEAADVDSDASITVIDATIIQQFVAHIITEFPAGYSYHYDKELIGITPDFMSGKAQTGTVITFTVNGYAHPGPSKTDFTINGEGVAPIDENGRKYAYVFDTPGVYTISVSMEDKWGVSAGSYSMEYEVVAKTEEAKLDIKNITYGPAHSISPVFEIEVSNAVGECTFDYRIYERFTQDSDKPVLVKEKLNTTENYVSTPYDEFEYGKQYVLHVTVTDSEGNKAQTELPFMYNPLPIG
ncbi:MAG: dockerin type I repeat-containing protein [Ruminococcus sp.]|nr:dockerin type I repeat-containing protein [Ruminococcus sp.]